MKKCCRYLDALDQNAQEDSSLWQDILMHASRCPDCSLDMQFRGAMLEKLAELPEPAYPRSLNQLIIEALPDNAANPKDEEDSGVFSSWFDRILLPVEVMVSAACLLMFVFLMHTAFTSHSPGDQLLHRHRSVNLKVSALPAIENNDLEKVSGAEVKDFLARLEEFKRLHPDKPSESQNLTPAIELANDTPWRQP
ncbi:MAG TPA: hypothetical protein PLM07_02745 [Candidatus Rifleibacterium sp.]|nr:hypothetical protein [Candidatus Rifleibacterium sp.]HPT44802.1 hypothetical protein [Candidatus Rifleibacterium sp.]